MLFWQRLVPGLLVGLLTLSTAQAINITASIDWESCQLPDSITNAGDYYSSSIESTTLTCSDATLSVSGAATSTTPWTVTSRIASTSSGITLNLDLMRNGNGSGDSTPTGGESYIAQTTAAQTLFTGQGNVSLIPIQFRIRNFDVTDGNGTKNIQLSYEINTH